MLSYIQKVHKIIQGLPPEMKGVATATAAIAFAAYGHVTFKHERFAAETRAETRGLREENLLLKIRVNELEREAAKQDAKWGLFTPFVACFKNFVQPSPKVVQPPQPSVPKKMKSFSEQKFFQEMSDCKGLEECSSIFKRYANCEGGRCAVVVPESLSPQSKPEKDEGKDVSLDGLKINGEEEESAPEDDKEK